MPRRKKVNGFQQALLDTPFGEWPSFARDAAHQICFTIPGKRVLEDIQRGEKAQAKRRLVELMFMARPSIEDL